MKRDSGIGLAFLLAGCLVAAAPPLQAQNAGQSKQQPAQQKSQPQQPAPVQPNGNPFPEDEKSVPMMPSGNTPDIPTDAGLASSPDAAPPTDSDPVRSPEDAASQGNGETQGFSSSQSGLDNLTAVPDTAPTGKKGKKGDDLADITPRETPREDIDVGTYYMNNKDWKGALSRFQSAMVLAPDNPDVYWGLAECERHLGQYAAARENYQKVVDYDPDSRHGKDAKKALKDPEVANAKP